MIKIPELELVGIITRGMSALREDYEEKQDKSKSLIAKLYEGVIFEKYNLYEEAIALFITNMKNTQGTSNRKISVKSYFDRNIRKVPAIHCAAPSEEEVMMAIGSGFGETNYLEGEDIVENRRKSYQSRHVIFFTSDNHIEVQLMYFTIKFLLVSIFDEYSLTTFQNPKITGNELRVDTVKAPEHFFVRGLTIDSFTEMNVPNFFFSENFSNLIFPRPNSEVSGNLGDTNLDIKTT